MSVSKSKKKNVHHLKPRAAQTVTLNTFEQKISFTFVWNVSTFPEEAHELLECSADCEWIEFNFLSWHGKNGYRFQRSILGDLCVYDKIVILSVGEIFFF